MNRAAILQVLQEQMPNLLAVYAFGSPLQPSALNPGDEQVESGDDLVTL